MKKLIVVSSAALATAVLTAVVTAGLESPTRMTAIHLTNNLNPGTGAGQFPAKCIGVVTTETLPAIKGDKVSWKIKNGNGENGDFCTGIDKDQVELHFDSDVMGLAAGRKLKAKGGSVDGQISSKSTEAPKGSHRYQVFYNGLAAGPDPEIDVDCPGCRPNSGSGK